MRNEVEPTVTHEERGGEKTEVLEHPAFGQISVHRITGARALYGSDFMHHSWVRIEVGPSQLHRGLSRDWYFRRRTMLSVDLSEAQWATFVSSFNVGEGVPCTIANEDGKYVPEFPLRDSTEKYKQEADDRIASSLKAVDAAIAEIDALNIPKIRKQALAGKLHRARRELESNLPFVAESFAEHMETRIEKAKIEVEGYINGRIRDAGLAALASTPVEGTTSPMPCIEMVKED